MPTMPPVFRPGSALTRREQKREHDAKRDDAEQRSWYKTTRWQKLKIAVHLRDGYVCRVTGVLCIGKHPADNSAVADHIMEPNGDPHLFWDIDNIRTVSKAYHDGERQRQQIAERGRGAGRKSTASLS